MGSVTKRGPYGPRPQPSALRALRGNLGRRPFNANEPTPPAELSATCPDELTDPIARKEWDRVAAGVIACGLVSSADRNALIGYCEQWARWRALNADAVACKAELDEQAKRWRLAFAAYAAFLKSAIELGMTPSSRSKVIATKPAPNVGKWAGLK